MNSDNKNIFLWNEIDRYVIKNIAKYRRIYISSLDNHNLLGFYKFWCSRLPIVPLTKNVEGISVDEILVYADEDVSLLPDGNKISIADLWNILSKKQKESLYKCSFISYTWGYVDEENATNMKYYINQFDKGYNTVVVADSNNNFVASVLLETFKNDFPWTHIRLWGDIYLNYKQNDEAMKTEFVDSVFSTKRKEVPFIKNNKVMAMGCLGYSDSTDLHQRDTDFPSLYWDFIDDYIIKSFFPEKTKILLSSNQNDLAAFQKRFQHIYDIEIYDGDLENYLLGKYDLLVYGADLWPITLTKKYYIRQLYADLLAEKVYRYLREAGVDYYYLSLTEHVHNMNARIKHKEVINENLPVQLSGVCNDYFIISDELNNSEYNVIGGQRHTVNALEQYSATIYMYGPCTVLGAYAKDDETIASYLQEIIKAKHMSYRVVNFGSNGGIKPVNLDINYLYQIMDMPLKRGDIVITFGFTLWKLLAVNGLDKVLKVSDAFNKHELTSVRCFTDDSAAHVDEKGNRVIAEYLWNSISSNMKGVPSINREDVKPLFMILDPTYSRKKTLLGEFLKQLAINSVHANKIGAVVANCNPFTKGHLYLIEYASKQVDFLYVFIVEEDLSDFKFIDRLNMAINNCRRFKNVKVLPSGRYMISRCTFAEYFQKDTIHNQKEIMPAKDVRIFAQAIAPCLNIRKRFVGEEPFDIVTKKYNDVMKKILPDYGIELVEIPRFKLTNGSIVNATYVRTLLKEGGIEKAKAYLTDESYDYIIQSEIY